MYLDAEKVKEGNKALSQRPALVIPSFVPGIHVFLAARGLENHSS
jgi:hypothetical protein